MNLSYFAVYFFTICIFPQRKPHLKGFTVLVSILACRTTAWRTEKEATAADTSLADISLMDLLTLLLSMSVVWYPHNRFQAKEPHQENKYPICAFECCITHLSLLPFSSPIIPPFQASCSSTAR